MADPYRPPAELFSDLETYLAGHAVKVEAFRLPSNPAGKRGIAVRGRVGRKPFFAQMTAEVPAQEVAAYDAEMRALAQSRFWKEGGV